MSYVGEARDGLPNHPVPQKARRTMTNLRTRLKTSSSGHPPQVGTMFPALKHHSQAPCTHKHESKNICSNVNTSYMGGTMLSVMLAVKTNVNIIRYLFKNNQ